ncbi:MAG: transposase [Rhodobiaceae bacterium]|nr:transposase [Rhodobiaceae bacterium]
MFFSTHRRDLNAARDNAREILRYNGSRPRVLSADNLRTFSYAVENAFKLIKEEKEILFFAVVQWLVIACAYVIWTQMLDWIPDSLWDAVASDNRGEGKGAFTLVNLALLAWSFAIVVVASYPISLMNAAMTAAHYLRSSGQSSTITKCINLAGRNLGRLWAYTSIDAWITVTAILDRLPKKKGNRTALDELLYYAWKLGTIAVVPALVDGKSFSEAGKASLLLLRDHPIETIGIRMGYSLVCWIVGVAAYVGALFWFMKFGAYGEHPNFIYNFYFLAAFPIFVAVGVVAVLIRPFFLLSVAKLYMDHAMTDEDAALLVPDVPERQHYTMSFVFALLTVALLGAYFFGDELGIRDMVEAIAQSDLEALQR